MRRLQELYPGDKFLQKSVKNNAILVSAFEKQSAADPEEQEPLETYIDFIDFRKIIETKENWPNFSDVFSIRLPEEPHAARYIKWFDELNRLRRISAHPFGKQYKAADIAILDAVYASLVAAGVLRTDG